MPPVWDRLIALEFDMNVSFCALSVWDRLLALSRTVNASLISRYGNQNKVKIWDKNSTCGEDRDRVNCGVASYALGVI